MSHTDLHAAARAALRGAQKRAAPTRPVRRAAKPKTRGRDKQTRAYLMALRGKNPIDEIVRRAGAFAHSASAFTTALVCGMACASTLMALNDVAEARAADAAFLAAERASPIVLSAQFRDLDFDGRADVASPAGFPRGEDHYGKGEFQASRDGGKRRHAGVDFTIEPGGAVRAPINGEVTLIGDAYERGSGLRFVEIHDPALSLTARVFYVAPTVELGQTLTAGESIGSAQDLAPRYPRGITNHVHVELKNAVGDHIDPAGVLPTPIYERAIYAHAGRAGQSTAR